MHSKRPYPVRSFNHYSVTPDDGASNPFLLFYSGGIYLGGGRRLDNVIEAISGIDEKRIVSGSYLYKNWIKTNIPKKPVESVEKLLEFPSSNPDYVWRYHTWYVPWRRE